MKWGVGARAGVGGIAGVGGGGGGSGWVVLLRLRTV